MARWNQPRKAYKVIALIPSQPDLREGDTIHEWLGHDYGLARDDSYAMKKPYIAVTRSSFGAGPFFTVALDALEEIGA